MKTKKKPARSANTPRPEPRQPPDAAPDSGQGKKGGFLVAAILLELAIPVLFYLEFGEVGPLGWGLTVFFAVIFILIAISDRYESEIDTHSEQKAKGDWIDRIGAFWLVCCAFGPLAGWAVSNVPHTVENWKLLYGIRIFLAAGLPVLTVFPHLRYLFSGKGVLIKAAILIVITLLPVSTAVNSIRDLLNGPEIFQVDGTGVGIRLNGSDRVIFFSD